MIDRTRLNELNSLEVRLNKIYKLIDEGYSLYYYKSEKLEKGLEDLGKIIDELKDKFFEEIDLQLTKED